MPAGLSPSKLSATISSWFPLEVQVEPEEYVEIINFHRAQAQVAGRHFQAQLVQAKRLFDARRIDMPGGEAFGLHREPAIGIAVAVFFNAEFAAVGFAKRAASCHRTAFAPARKEMQHCFPVVRQIELRAKSHVYIEIITERSKWNSHMRVSIALINELIYDLSLPEQALHDGTQTSETPRRFDYQKIIFHHP